MDKFYQVNGTKIVDFEKMTKSDWAELLTNNIENFRLAVQVITNNPLPATFENTFLDLEKLYLPLMDSFGALQSAQAHATNDINDLIDKFSPIITELFSSLYQNKSLMERMQQAYQVYNSTWNKSQLKLYFDAMNNFKNSGVFLAENEKSKASKLMSDISKLENEFNKINLKNSANTISILKTDLEGVDNSLLESCETLDNHVLIPIQGAYIDVILESCKNRNTRKSCLEAFTKRGTGINKNDINTSKIVNEILVKRNELAKTLGFDNFSDYVLSTQMATTQLVEKTLYDIYNKLKLFMQNDLKNLESIAITENISKIEPFDVSYLVEKYKAINFNINNNEIKEYFLLNNVRDKAFEIANKIFGVSFKENKSIPTYHEDTRTFEVFKDNKAIGVIIIDDFLRPTKAPGAWMNQFATPSNLKGMENNAAVINVLNIPKSDNPLLTFDEVITLFHELGHALHGLLGKTDYPSQSGTNVVRDFVEFPSQILENWATNKDSLAEIALHYKTNEKMPQLMLDNLINANNFGQSFFKMSYILSAITDFEIHSKTSKFIKENIQESEQDILRLINAPLEVLPRHHFNHFSHLFAGGYASNYYSYLWAEILEADAFNKFLETDLFDKETCDKLCELYSHGGSIDAMELFTNFQGRPPDNFAVFKKWSMDINTQELTNSTPKKQKIG